MKSTQNKLQQIFDVINQGLSDDLHLYAENAYQILIEKGNVLSTRISLPVMRRILGGITPPHSESELVESFLEFTKIHFNEDNFNQYLEENKQNELDVESEHLAALAAGFTDYYEKKKVIQFTPKLGE